LIVRRIFINSPLAALAVILSQDELNRTWPQPFRDPFAACHEPASGRTLRAAGCNVN
jgi:hypothetical protein